MHENILPFFSPNKNGVFGKKWLCVAKKYAVINIFLIFGHTKRNPWRNTQCCGCLKTLWKLISVCFFFSLNGETSPLPKNALCVKRANIYIKCRNGFRCGQPRWNIWCTRVVYVVQGCWRGRLNTPNFIFCNQIYNFSSQEHKPSPVVTWYTRVFPRSTLAASTSDTHRYTLLFYTLVWQFINILSNPRVANANRGGLLIDETLTVSSNKKEWIARKKYCLTSVSQTDYHLSYY